MPAAKPLSGRNTSLAMQRPTCFGRENSTGGLVIATTWDTFSLYFSLHLFIIAEQLTVLRCHMGVQKPFSRSVETGQLGALASWQNELDFKAALFSTEGPQ